MLEFWVHVGLFSCTYWVGVGWGRHTTRQRINPYMIQIVQTLLCAKESGGTRCYRLIDSTLRTIRAMSEHEPLPDVDLKE